jgi:hypothetical protein
MAKGKAKIPGRTPWHPLFAALISESLPPGFKLQSEVVLSLEPRRADLLLIRNDGKHVHEGKVLRHLWPLLSSSTLVEFKSVSRPAGPTAWMQLLSYGAQYHEAHFKELGPAKSLSLVLVTPRFNRALKNDVAGLGITYEDLGHGYYRVHGFNYPTFLVVLEQVRAQEQEPLLEAFTEPNIDVLSETAHQWLHSHIFGELRTKMIDLEGYKEIAHALTLKNIGTLSPKERLAGLSPEERLADLSPDEKILAFPDEALRALSSDYIASLSPETQAEIRRRLSH